MFKLLIYIGQRIVYFCYVSVYYNFCYTFNIWSSKIRYLYLNWKHNEGKHRLNAHLLFFFFFKKKKKGTRETLHQKYVFKKIKLWPTTWSTNLSVYLVVVVFMSNLKNILASWGFLGKKKSPVHWLVDLITLYRFINARLTCVLEYALYLFFHSSLRICVQIYLYRSFHQTGALK